MNLSLPPPLAHRLRSTVANACYAVAPKVTCPNPECGRTVSRLDLRPTALGEPGCWGCHDD